MESLLQWYEGMAPFTPWRSETDSMGSKRVRADALWGAQTQRSLENFAISSEMMPVAVIHALVIVKKACAKLNMSTGALDWHLGEAILQAADEILAGRHANQFPLSLWQTGSGTQTNMNVNEVLANRASEILGGQRGDHRLVHPNDHVNLGQSSNDAFPSAMAVAAVKSLTDDFFPALKDLRQALQDKAQEFSSVIKVGRTHLMDATPITLGQEFSGYVSQLDHCLAHVRDALPHLQELALGGTAVGTGLNSPPGFGENAAQEISSMTSLVFTSASNKFEAVATSDAFVQMHGTLKGTATALLKIANDLRLMGSGPRAGLGEISFPENEPGSSIMPGKVNPTQCEALIMACMQVMGNDLAISMAGASGNFELNVCRPLIAHAFLQSVRLLSDSTRSLSLHCIQGLKANQAKIAENLNNSLMLVTALVPHVGYDAAAQVARRAKEENLSLKEAVVSLGLATASQYDEWVKPIHMVGSQNAARPAS